MRLKRGLVVLVLIVCVCTLAACSFEEKGVLYFGTYFDQTLRGAGSAKTAKQISQKMDKLNASLSTNVVDSDLWRFNESGADTPVSVSEDTIYLLKLSKEFYEKSAGAFNPAMFPIVELWGLSPSKNGLHKAVPEPSSVAEALAYTDFSDVIINENDLTVLKKKEGVKIDLGAIAKGYATDVAVKIAEGLDSGLINAGGTIKVFGESAKIAIEDPRGSGYLGTLVLADRAVATSGDYERYFMDENGVRYHHIFDATGYPAHINSENKITSVTVVASSGAIADALSTTVFILGEAGAGVLEEYGASALIAYEDKTYRIIGDMDFTLKNTEYTER